jgi:hypothetical protein
MTKVQTVGNSSSSSRTYVLHFLKAGAPQGFAGLNKPSSYSKDSAASNEMISTLFVQSASAAAARTGHNANVNT